MGCRVQREAILPVARGDHGTIEWHANFTFRVAVGFVACDKREIIVERAWKERGKSAELARKLILSSFASENDT